MGLLASFFRAIDNQQAKVNAEMLGQLTTSEWVRRRGMLGACHRALGVVAFVLCSSFFVPRLAPPRWTGQRQQPGGGGRGHQVSSPRSATTGDL